MGDRIRQITRELHHAQADLDHGAFPNHATVWQDDVECAAAHIEAAHRLMCEQVSEQRRASGESRRGLGGDTDGG